MEKSADSRTATDALRQSVVEVLVVTAEAAVVAVDVQHYYRFNVVTRSEVLRCPRRKSYGRRRPGVSQAHDETAQGWRCAAELRRVCGIAQSLR